MPNDELKAAERYREFLAGRISQQDYADRRQDEVLLIDAYLAHPPLTEHEINAILGRWDQTAPNLQRKIMAETSVRLFKTKRALAEAQHALADAHPPLTRERVAEAVGELFHCVFGHADLLVMTKDNKPLGAWAWAERPMVDRLCRLLGVDAIAAARPAGQTREE